MAGLFVLLLGVTWGFSAIPSTGRAVKLQVALDQAVQKGSRGEDGQDEDGPMAAAFGRSADSQSCCCLTGTICLQAFVFPFSAFEPKTGILCS